jgi:hypothetical protein
VLADPEVELARVPAVRLEVRGAVDVLEAHGGGVGEVGGARDQPGDSAGDGVLDLIGRLPGRHPLLVGIEAGDLGVPAFW